jgi:hypothetical protein
MIRTYLESNGYEGLCSPGNECGCLLNDLMPCGGEFAMECESGHRIDCPDSCGENCDYHVVAGAKEESSVSESPSLTGYAEAVRKLRAMAAEREAMFDGRTHRMGDAMALSSQIEKLKWAADMLEAEA